MKVKNVFMLLISLLFLASCDFQSQNVEVISSEIMDEDMPKDYYIKSSYGFSSLKKLPDWAENLKETNNENPYAINVYDNLGALNELTEETLTYKGNIFGKISNNNIFENYNVLVIARRTDNYKYAISCRYSNYKYENQTHYIDATYFYKNACDRYSIEYTLDFVAIDKSILTKKSNAKYIVNQNYYPNYEKNKIIKERNGYKQINIYHTNKITNQCAIFFDNFDDLDEYVDKYSNVDIEEFINKKWLKNHYALVVIRIAPHITDYEYDSVVIDGDTINLKAFNEGFGLAAQHNYLDIIFLPKNETKLVEINKSYNVNINTL